MPTDYYQTFTRLVVDAMLDGMGWAGKQPPSDVIDSVFTTIDEHEHLYNSRLDPTFVAQSILRAAWSA